MMLYTLRELLSRLRFYLDGKTDFSDVREWVYEFYWAEQPIKLDGALEEVFPVLLPYLQDEEAFEDTKRDVRVRRVCELLDAASSLFTERTVFALEFDEIRVWTKKLSDALISDETYQRKMATLSSAPYDVIPLIQWAKSHKDETEPVLERLT